MTPPPVREPSPPGHAHRLARHDDVRAALAAALLTAGCVVLLLATLESAGLLPWSDAGWHVQVRSTAATAALVLLAGAGLVVAGGAAIATLRIRRRTGDRPPAGGRDAPSSSDWWLDAAGAGRLWLGSRPGLVRLRIVHAWRLGPLLALRAAPVACVPPADVPAGAASSAGAPPGAASPAGVASPAAVTPSRPAAAWRLFVRHRHDAPTWRALCRCVSCRSSFRSSRAVTGPSA